MKKCLFLFFMFLSSVIISRGQNLPADFVVVDKTYGGAEQVIEQTKEQYCVLSLTSISAIEQISVALQGKKINDLHIYVAAKPGTIGFCNIALNLSSIVAEESSLYKWSSSVSGKVVIHNSTVFETAMGLEFKAKLEQVTGLIFVAQ